MLYIGRQVIVDNDGVHAAVNQDGITHLTASMHEITVVFFEKAGGESLDR
jgi:hypothetical protein